MADQPGRYDPARYARLTFPKRPATAEDIDKIIRALGELSRRIARLEKAAGVDTAPGAIRMKTEDESDG